jgi:hypothetical protein
MQGVYYETITTRISRNAILVFSVYLRRIYS